MLRSLCLIFALLCSSMSFASNANASKVILTINGQVKSPQTLSLADLDKLPQKKLTVMTPWYPNAQIFEGPLLRDVLKQSGLQQGKTMKLIALNDYSVTVPLSDIEKYDVIVASRLNGKTMTVREKGPLFVMYPFDRHPEIRKTEFFSRCAWQLKQIMLE